MKSFKDISEKLKKDKDDPCWKGYVQLGTKKKNGKEVPNCVPKEGVDEKKDTHKTKDGRTAKKGLWYNINQKKKRGEAPAKKGDPDYPKTLNIESIEEKAVSKAQQKFMGMVRAKQKGEMPNASPEVSKAAASMSKKDVKDFAKTKHKGLPAKKESVQEAKVSVGDRVTLQPNKSVLDRNLIGKAGVVTNMLDGDAMVKFANGRTIAVSPRHLKINESVELDEAKAYVSSISPKMGRKGSHDVIGKDGNVVKSFPYTKDGMKAAQAHLSKMKEETELDEALGPIDKDQLAKLKKAYADIDRINVSSPAYKKLRKWIASLDKEDLMTLVKAKVRWISQLAASELRLTHKVKVSPKEYMESMNFFEFRETLKEAKGSNYQIYHKTYSGAVQHAVNHAFHKMGYEVDAQDFFNKVSSGPRKPSPGKTNSFSIDLFDKKTYKPVRQKLHIQVYGMDSGKYELNMYVS